MPSTQTASCPKRGAGPPSEGSSTQLSSRRENAHMSPKTVPPALPPNRSAVVPSPLTVQVWSSRAAGPTAVIGVHPIIPGNGDAPSEAAADGCPVAMLDADGMADADGASVG